MSATSASTVNRARDKMSAALVPAVVRETIQRFLPSSSGSLLPFIPKPLKAILLLLVILNSPSFPFQWHLRVWYHALKAYYYVYRKGRSKYLDDWEAKNVRQGQVKGVVSKMKRVAWVDDCDYNMHLSNSCYAKNSDPARMQHAIESLSPGFTPGIFMALAGSHFIYIKEIPMGMEYTMETRAIGWGEKWFYLTTEFIIYPKKKPTKRSASSSSSSSAATDKLAAGLHEAGSKLASASVSSSSLPVPSLSSVDAAVDASASASSSVGDSGIATPVSASTKQAETSDNSQKAKSDKLEDLEEAKRAALRQRPARADGGVVACLAVWEYCFKIGRVTVPPRIGLYLSLQSPLPADRAAARRIILSKDQGRAWSKGGWRNEPNADDIGRDIGVVPTQGAGVEAVGVPVPQEAQEGENWVQRGRRAMEGMTLGLASI